MPERFNCVVMARKAPRWISEAVIESLADDFPMLEREPSSALFWVAGSSSGIEEPWPEAKDAILGSLASGNIVHVYFQLKQRSSRKPARVSVGLEADAGLLAATISFPRRALADSPNEDLLQLAMRAFSWARRAVQQPSLACGPELELVSGTPAEQATISATFASDLFEIGIIPKSLAALVPASVSTANLDDEFLLVRSNRSH